MSKADSLLISYFLFQSIIHPYFLLLSEINICINPTMLILQVYCFIKIPKLHFMYKSDLMSPFKIWLIIVFKWFYCCEWSHLITIVWILHLVTQQHEFSSLMWNEGRKHNSETLCSQQHHRVKHLEQTALNPQDVHNNTDVVEALDQVQQQRQHHTTHMWL